MEFDERLKLVLKELALSNAQADVYITLLKNGAMSVSHLAKFLGLNRTNSYAILERLKSLDLIWEENKASGKLIHAKPYQGVLNALDIKEQKLKEYRSTINELIPVFKTFSSKEPSITNIKVFDKLDGLEFIIDDILKKTAKDKEILLFSNQASEEKYFSKSMHENFIKRRVKSSIKIRVLTVDNERGRELVGLDKNSLRETKILPKSFSFNSEIYIYDKKITMLDLKANIVSVVIESEELFKIHTQIFEFLWNSF